jgi:hypothetical protein
VQSNAFESEIEEFQGVHCIKFGSGKQKWGHEIWWLDPSRRFALLGYEHTNIRGGREWPLESMRVVQLKEILPNIWWPTEATLISGPKKLGSLYRKTVYKASSVVANDPKFDNTVFTISLPQGYLIDDQVKGLKYRVGAEDEPKDKPLDGQCN